MKNAGLFVVFSLIAFLTLGATCDENNPASSSPIQSSVGADVGNTQNPVGTWTVTTKNGTPIVGGEEFRLSLGAGGQFSINFINDNRSLSGTYTANDNNTFTLNFTTSTGGVTLPSPRTQTLPCSVVNNILTIQNLVSSGTDTAATYTFNRA